MSDDSIFFSIKLIKYLVKLFQILLHFELLKMHQSKLQSLNKLSPIHDLLFPAGIPLLIRVIIDGIFS